MRLEAGGAPDAEALAQELAGRLPRFKIPRHFFPWPEEQQVGMKIARKEFAARAERLAAALP